MNARSTAAQAVPSPVLVRENLAGLALLTLNRPKTRNTLSEAMLAALADELTAIAEDQRGSRSRAGGEGTGLFRWSRSQGVDRATLRYRPRPRLFPHM